MNTPITSEKMALDKFSIISKTDLKGRIIDVNQNFCNVSGYSHEELIGSPHSIVKSGYHDKDFYLDMWKTISRGHVWQGEICNRTKAGYPYWVFTTIVPLNDEAGKPHSYYSLRIEITERKKAEKKVKEQHDKLSRFAYLTTNDLRYPIKEIKRMLQQSLKGDLALTNELIQQLFTRAEELESLTRIMSDVVSANGLELGLVRRMNRRLPAQNIMVIDDDSLQCNYIRQVILKTVNTAEVVNFYDPQEALKYLNRDLEKKPEVLFLDVNMPKLSAFDFLEEANQHLINTDVHVLTEIVDPKVVKQSQDWPMIKSYIHKPLNEIKLNKVLNP